jgi:hypothetical protein
VLCLRDSGNNRDAGTAGMQATTGTPAQKGHSNNRDAGTIGTQTTKRTPAQDYRRQQRGRQQRRDAGNNRDASEYRDSSNHRKFSKRMKVSNSRKGGNNIIANKSRDVNYSREASNSREASKRGDTMTEVALVTVCAPPIRVVCKQHKKLQRWSQKRRQYSRDDARDSGGCKQSKGKDSHIKDNSCSMDHVSPQAICQLQATRQARIATVKTIAASGMTQARVGCCKKPDRRG